MTVQPLRQWGTIERGLLAGIVLLCAIYAVAAVIVRPSVGVDPAYGLRVYQSMQAGAPWNHRIEPDASDISRDTANFIAMFSPGQYLVPAPLMDAGLSMGVALMLVSIGVTFLGLFGWYQFYRVLGHEPRESLLACSILAASRSVNHAFVAYLGGEILAFAVFPFLAAGAVRLRNSRWLPVYAVGAVLVGFLAKNSQPIYFAGWLAAQAAIPVIRRQRPLSITPSMVALLAAGVTMILLHVFYDLRGWTALTYQPAAATSLRPYLLPWSMPILAATSWDDVFSWIFMHPSGTLVAFDYKSSIPVLAAIGAGSLVAAVLALKREHDDRVLQLFLYSVITLAALTVLLSSGAIISLDLSRHYRWIGYVWLALIARPVLRARPVVAVTVALLLAVPCAYGLGSFASNWRRHYSTRASQSTRLRITHPQVTPGMARALETLDRELPAGALVVTPVPTYALEFLRTRALPTNIVADEVRQMPKRHGRASNLILIADRRAMSDAKCAEWLASFPDYDQWDQFDLDEHRFYVPVGQTVNTAWLEAALQ